MIVSTKSEKPITNPDEIPQETLENLTNNKGDE